MSVYTHIHLEDLPPLLDAYGLGPALALTPIQGGIENSNYFLSVEAEGDPRELVLTLFEELSPTEASFIPALLSHLHAAGLRVAAPLPTRHSAHQPQFFGKTVQLAPRLAGIHPAKPSREQCRAMGETLAQLHLALRDYPLQRHNAHGADWWEGVATRWRGELDVVDRLLLDKCLEDYATACARWPELPRGLIHGDLFRDNSLFTGDALSGVLDFSETGQDHWLLDIAITVNDFCRAWPALGLRQESLRAFLAGYDSHRPLTAEEKQALPTFLAVAALRFWLSRLDVALRNKKEGRSGEHVLEKDPREMRDILADRLCLTPADLGL